MLQRTGGGGRREPGHRGPGGLPVPTRCPAPAPPRSRRAEPPDADPAPARSSGRWPHRNLMRQRLLSANGKARYKLRKQTVEPVIGQIKGARGFRQFLCRGLEAVRAGWSLACTAHNILKLGRALTAV